MIVNIDRGRQSTNVGTVFSHYVYKPFFVNEVQRSLQSLQAKPKSTLLFYSLKSSFTFNFYPQMAVKCFIFVNQNSISPTTTIITKISQMFSSLPINFFRINTLVVEWSPLTPTIGINPVPA